MINRCAIVITFLLAVSVQAADDPARTLNILNGRGWTQLRKMGRAEAYLTGLYDGLNYYGPHEEFRTDAANIGFTPAEIVAGVTAFYAADPARMRIPVPMAVAIFLRHAEGETDAQIEERVQNTLRDLDEWIAKAHPPRRR